MLLKNFLEESESEAQKYYSEVTKKNEEKKSKDNPSNIIIYNGKTIDTLSPRYVNLLTLFKGNEEYAKKVF